MKRLPVLLLALALGGCTLPGGAPDGPSYRVTAEFADALDLVPQAAVKVNDVTVGSVECCAHVFSAIAAASGSSNPVA